ncbi:MAG TPA: ABC transporter permease [Pyrinomonadaceae bacterium]|nr:ABC transporter permease [Pyrinomonadaceae bacterium]
MLRTLWQDLRYGARTLLKSSGFTAVAVITIALGVGANTAIFSLVSAVLLRPLNYHEPDRLVMVWESDSAVGDTRDTIAPANYADWQAQNQSFEDMAAFEWRNFNLTGDGEPERVPAFGVSANFFPLLGARPALGRAFQAEEDRPGADKVAVISHGLWQSRFGGQQGIVGRNILLNGEPYTIVGVMPSDFQFMLPNVNLWVPMALTPEQLAERDLHNLNAVARLRPGVTVEQADADMKAITHRIAAAYPDEAEGLSAAVVPLHEQLADGAHRPLMLLLAAVGFVLLIACANVAGMLLARAAARRREIAVRAALGASRWRIARQLLTEGALLGVSGGGLGLLLSVWAFAFLQQLIPAGMTASATLELDARVLCFTLAISLLAALIFSLAPALQASKADLNLALKQGGGRAGLGVGQRWLRSGFVVAQVALSLVLLVGAGLLVQTLYKLRGQYAELRPESVLTVRTQLVGAKYREHEQRVAFYDGVLARVGRLPGVVGAGYTTAVPLTGMISHGLTLEGRQEDPNVNWNAIHRQVSPDYFRAMGIELRQGRAFNAEDDERAMPVAVVNETMARQFWPGESPVGKRFKAGRLDSPDPWLTIVGVVADVRQMGVDAPAKAELYVPYRQFARDSTLYPIFAPRDLVIRTTAEPLSLVPAVRQAVREVDPHQPLSSIRTMDEVLALVTAQRRVGMVLLTAFAALALLLAALGIYGVLSYFVIRHTPEIGVRVALGAQKGDVLRLVLGRGMRLALAGIFVGLAGAFALTRLMESLLFGVSAVDPLTFAGVAVLLAVVALLACYIPARRAMKVDPMAALRYE